jgi:serine/threonine protein kinase
MDSDAIDSDAMDSDELDRIPNDDEFTDLPAQLIKTPQVATNITPEQLRQPELNLGSVLGGRYELMEVLGRGGFAVVYKAKQLHPQRMVAVKVMLSSHLLNLEKADSAIRSFEIETRLIAALNHPNIVQLIDAGRLESGLLYMVLEYIEGQTLADLLKAEGALSPTETKRLMGQVLEALGAAHQRGVVHRDLKPHNIMITDVGIARCAKVLDFGVARVVEEASGNDLGTLTATGQVAGTPHYMPPEQLRGQRTLQSDIYAWGLILLECLTGQRVVDERLVSRAIQRQLQKQPVEIPPQWRSGEFGVLLRRCLSKSLKLRFQSVAEVMAELERPTRPSSGDDVAVSGVRQQVEGAAAVGEGVPVWWVAAVGGAFLLGAGLALVWWLA